MQTDSEHKVRNKTQAGKQAKYKTVNAAYTFTCKTSKPSI